MNNKEEALEGFMAPKCEALANLSKTLYSRD
jgi:hypothetical protein